MRNTPLKRGLRWMARMMHALISVIVRILPYKVYRILAKILIVFGELLMIPKKRIALDNLRIAFGREKSKKEIHAIMKKYYRHFSRGMIDFIYLTEHPHLIAENVRIEGRAYLDQALAEGNGVIFTGGHFGNFLLMYWKLAAEGYSTNVIMRHVHDASFENVISGIREKSGVRAIFDLPARKCVVESIKALRKNGLLFILLDQNYGSEGRVFVDFFNKKAATATGPVVFSLRTKAPILPIFCIKDQGELKHKIVIKAPIVLEEGKDEQDTVIRNVSQITRIIEEQIKTYPHEWGGWIHKRWKSKPLYEQEIIDRLKGYKKSLVNK